MCGGLDVQKVCGLLISHLLNSPRDRNKVDGVNLIAISELLVLIRGHGDIVSSSCDYFKQKEPFALCVGLDGQKVCGLLISQLLNAPRDRSKVDDVKLIAFSELLIPIRGHGDIVSSSCDFFKQKQSLRSVRGA